MVQDLFLGIDVGSSGTRGVLVDANGRPAAVAELPHGISRPRSGWAEQDAERDWWAGAARVCRRLVSGRATRVAAVGVTGLGPCLVPADAEGRPLRPAILYGIDTRASDQIARLTAELGADEILARCGARLTSQSVGPKVRWVLEEEPQVWDATRRVFGATSYLVSRLTGEYVLDHHSASHWAPLYDQTKNSWIGEWTERVAPGLTLPGLVWPQETCGRVSREAARATGLAEGTPVAGGTIDSWAEVAAAGLRGPGEGLLVYGTSMFLTEVGSPARVDARLWRTVGFAPGSHNVAAGVGSSGALTAWLRGLTGNPPYDELFEEAERAGPGAGGLLALPYFAGERTPWFDPDLRGALFGLTAAHGRGYVFRALLEATAFAVRQNLEVMREAGATIASLRGSGGGATELLWPQIVADVSGVSQDVRQGSDRASIGAALFAAIAVGAATLETEWVTPSAPVVPRTSLRSLYDDLYGQFRELTLATLPQAHALAAWQRDHGEPDAAARTDLPRDMNPRVWVKTLGHSAQQESPSHHGGTMSDAPLDLYIAGYSDPVSAKEDFDALKKAQREGIVMIDGAVLVSRDADGTMHVKESGDHDVFKGATVGIAGGLVLGLFAPPLLGAMVVGGVIGGLVGKLAKHHDEKGIAKDIEDVVPPGTSGVIAVFEEIWVDEVERQLAKAEKKAVKEADKQTAKELKASLEDAKTKE